MNHIGLDFSQTNQLSRYFFASDFNSDRLLHIIHLIRLQGTLKTVIIPPNALQATKEIEKTSAEAPATLRKVRSLLSMHIPNPPSIKSWGPIPPDLMNEFKDWAVQNQGPIEAFLSDVEQLPICRLPTNGNRGPTVLIHANPRPFVLKQTTHSEIFYTALYNSLISQLEMPNSRIVIPDMVGFNFNGKTRYTCDTRTSLDEETSEQLNTDSIAILQETCRIFEKPFSLNEDPRFLFFEKVTGDTFFTFVSGRYEDSLQDQKSSFFMRIGNLIMLDICVGNLDRLLRFTSELTQKNVYSANLGNVLISTQGETFALHPIDNGLDLTPDQPAAYELYTQNICNILKTASGLDILATHARDSLQTGINHGCDDIPIADRPDCKNFLADLLTTQAFEDLKSGFKQMLDSLAKIQATLQSVEVEKFCHLRNIDEKWFEAARNRLAQILDASMEGGNFLSQKPSNF